MSRLFESRHFLNLLSEHIAAIKKGKLFANCPCDLVLKCPRETSRLGDARSNYVGPSTAVSVRRDARRTATHSGGPRSCSTSDDRKSSGMSELSPHQKVNDSGGNGDHEDRKRLEVHLERVISTTYETMPDQNQRQQLDRGQVSRRRTE